MRTTLEIADEHRARLLRLAASRGEKGFSGVVNEAIERYLSEIDSRSDLIAAARAALGSLDDDTARDLEESARAARSSWR